MTKHASRLSHGEAKNASMKISGANYALLLLRKDQIDAGHSLHWELTIKEQWLRGMSADREEVIEKMKKMLIDNEHPILKQIHFRVFFDLAS